MTRARMSDPPRVFVLARAKATRRCWSAFITRRLNALGVRAYRVVPNTTPKYRPERVGFVINYGCSTVPEWLDRLPNDCVWFNTPDEVRVSANKVLMMRALPSQYTLGWTENKQDAAQYIGEGATMVARTLISSHSGKGIVLSPPDPLPDAKLYTVLKRHTGLREYRIWFSGGEVLDVACKKRWRTERLRLAGIDPDDRLGQVVRAHRYGWVFTRNDMPVTDNDVFTSVVRVARELLSWGCVDVLIDTETKAWTIVEINSAPGMSDRRTRESIMGSLVRVANDLTT